MKLIKGYLYSTLLFFLLSGAVHAQNELKVMTYNRLFTASTASAVNVVQSSGADIIGMQESFGVGQSVANALGFYYEGSGSESIISRYPITSTSESGVTITLPSGLEVYVFNAHLTSFPYQPYDIRDGDITSESQAISEANGTRSSEMRAIVNAIENTVPIGAPVFFTGDFNEPSHLDWTQRAADRGIHAAKVSWPTSQQATNIGMIDSWRFLYPDEVARPGNTWTPNISANEVYDRIDIIYHRGNEVLATEAVRYGPIRDEAEISLSGYTSDHRALMVTYDIPEPTSGGDETDYGSNLLAQNSAEENILNQWVQISGTQKRAQGGQNGYPGAKDGNYIFWLGNTRDGEVYQEVDVSEYANGIDAGVQSFLFNGFVRTYNGSDRSRIIIEYLDDDNAVLDTFDSDWRNNSSSWASIDDERVAPIGTRTIKVTLRSMRGFWGSSNDGYFDDLSLRTGLVSATQSTRTRQHSYQSFPESDIQFIIWPNPAAENIYLRFNQNTGGEVSIINMLGQSLRKVFFDHASNMKVPINEISSGQYILQFVDQTGLVYRETIIIK
ncbi:MAG: endonuclease/exonuclease/phosphatase family protein [Bacteroidota bacterium]